MMQGADGRPQQMMLVPAPNNGQYPPGAMIYVPVNQVQAPLNQMTAAPQNFNYAPSNFGQMKKP
jgi:hypothetical protein